MVKRASPNTQRQISALEELITKAGKIKKKLSNPDARFSSFPWRDVVKEYLQWLLKAGTLIGKRYRPLVYQRFLEEANARKSPPTILLYQAKSTMLGDIICIEDEITEKLIRLKQQSSESSHLIKEHILKELSSNKELKEMDRNIRLVRLGAMARYIEEWGRSRDKTMSKEVRYSPAYSEQLKHLYEIQLKNKIRELLVKRFGRKVSGTDFDIAYLEAKDELAGQKVGEDGKEKEILEEENSKYIVCIPKANGFGTQLLRCSESKLNADFLDKRDNFDVLVNERNVYIKKINQQTKKKELVFVNIEERVYKLLVLLLKYKDKALDIRFLFKKVWAYVDRDSSGIPESKVIVRDYLKVPMSQIRALIHPHNLKIEKPRNSDSYTCHGSLNFCVIIDKKDKEKFELSNVGN